MEERILSLWFDQKSIEDTNRNEWAERRNAIQLFLDNPDALYHQHPSLLEDLITFFSRSSNPHVDAHGNIMRGREEQYEKWEAARQWALMRSKN